jgi:two-component system KDP operon response regulator KdpE
MTFVLLVEDDDRLRRALTVTLRSRGLEVTEVGRGLDALDVLSTSRVDVIVLDLGLPDVDGLEVIVRARAISDAPILVLSARRDQLDKVAALDRGADDYLTKPFGVDELLARTRAALRRSGGSPEPRVVSTADFVIDLGRRTVVSASGELVRLTPTEWGLLEVLVLANGLVVTGEDLLSKVWGSAYRRQTNYLRVYFAQLRRKLEPVPSAPRYLITVPGIGYRFDLSASGSATGRERGASLL